jgi:hypothetical protein
MNPSLREYNETVSFIKNSFTNHNAIQRSSPLADFVKGCDEDAIAKISYEQIQINIYENFDGTVVVITYPQARDEAFVSDIDFIYDVANRIVDHVDVDVEYDEIGELD